jgi:hypothetical protein
MSVVFCPGFKETGNVAGVMVNPAPVRVAPLIVTGAVPVELMVTVCATGVFTVMLPKAKPAGVTLSAGAGTLN